jgi:hypothetical protein
MAHSFRFVMAMWSKMREEGRSFRKKSSQIVSRCNAVSAGFFERDGVKLLGDTPARPVAAAVAGVGKCGFWRFANLPGSGTAPVPGRGGQRSLSG